MDDKQIELIQDDDPYTKVYNALILDDRLRLQTRMVLIMMTSVPPDWDFSIRGMAKIAHVTKDTMSKMLSELETAGYVKRKAQARGSAGQFAKAGYLVSRKPIFGDTYDAVPKNQDTVKPCPDSSYTMEPYTKNSPQLNNKQLTTKQSSSPCSPPDSPADCLPGDAPSADSKPVDKPASKPKRSRKSKYNPTHDPEAFEIIWGIYPRKDGRDKAVKKWDEIKPDRELCRVMYKAIKRQCKSEQWARDEGKYIPMLSTWLHGGRWKDQGVDLSLLQASQPRNTSGWAEDPEVPS